MAIKLIPTPGQTVGPFFALGLDRPEWADMTRDNPQGERIVIEGQVRDGDGAPVPDAVIELWQANAAGRYNSPADDQTDKPIDPNFIGFGRAATDGQGRFTVATIKPGPVPGRGNALQAPHINVAFFARGLLKQLFTRIYFSDSAENAADPLLSGIDDNSVRDTLIARRGEGGVYRFDFVLQGKDETAFLDL
ncbi:MAG TPA: protocatechuate 3,4-dioxygenase subunit alpha [Stellaceae bacterium]|nr:protocatechuate 3,4-dioxygenase subunit alpha [Stellaceae bacterium]